jgi:hypothetical protein
MEQMNTEGLKLVHVDFDSEDVPASVKQTRPVIYEEGEAFCCLLGPDPEGGIFGRGRTLQDALVKFDRQFQDRLEHPIKGDPVSEFIQQRHI